MKRIFRNPAEKRRAIIAFIIILIMVFFTMMNLIEKRHKERNERFHRELIESMEELDRRLDTLNVKVAGSELLARKYEVVRFIYPYDIEEVFRASERGSPIEYINYISDISPIKEGYIELTRESARPDSFMFH